MTTCTSLPRTVWAIFLLLPAILALFNLRPVAASTDETDVTTATIILTPAADSTIDQLKPTANYGTQDMVHRTRSLCHLPPRPQRRV